MENEKRIKELKEKYKNIDFSLVKAVVDSNDINKILKTKKDVPMVGTYKQCSSWMLQRFSRKSNASIVMRDVEAFDPKTMEIYLGNLTR